jgi:hypothetical protein
MAETINEKDLWDYERVIHAEAYVRDVLRIMGQHKDADNSEHVRSTALKVLKSIYGRRVL